MSLANLDLNLLKVLDALIEERSVTRAAKRLGRTQPAISNALSRLRHTLGDQLFVRGQDGLELTSRTQSMRQPLRELIGLAEICFSEEAQFDPSSASGEFRVAMPDRLGVPISPLIVQRLDQLAPNMSLHVRTAERDQAVQLLADDRIDLAVGWLENHPGYMNAEYLMDEAFFCLLRGGHPILRDSKTLDQTSLLHYPHLLVSATGGTSAIFDELLIPHKLQRSVRVSVSNFSTVPFMLAGSDMIGVFTRLVTEVFERNFELIRVPVPIDVGTVASSMVWHTRNDGDPKHNWLRAQIKAVCVDL